ncbi:MAG: BamA/TamA family outer membrane protein [Chitinophagaceae bacterium]|nr:BamA/TamA family outer membrane protein [Oligoflexus sp.]
MVSSVLPLAQKRLGWVMLALCLSSTAMARGWELRTNSDTLKIYAADVKTTVPDIKTGADLENLLNRFTEANSLAYLNAYLENNTVILEAEVAPIIRSIVVKTLTRSIRFDIESKLGKYLAQTDSEELRRQIIEEILADLRSKSFYQARVQFESAPGGSGVNYALIVDEGIPCKVARVDSNFSLPPLINNPFRVGMECNISEIRNRLTDLERELVSAGYNLQRIQTPALIYDDKSNTARLRFEGSLGKKVRYRIVSPVKAPGMLSSMFGDSLNTLDASITDPDAMASELTRKYQSQGYDDVDVGRPRLHNLDPETIEYEFTINPGPEYRIVDVQYEGLISMTPEEASDAIDMKTSVGAAPVFSQELVIAARDRLISLYQRKGYWDVGVFEPRIIKNPGNGEVKLVFVVREGKKRTFDRLVITGNQAVPTEAIQDLITLESGDSLDRQKLVTFEKQLRSLYRQKGYLHLLIAVDLEQNRALRDVETRVVVRITEGKKSRFGEVFVKGLIKTDQRVVQREMRFKAGDDFNPDVVEESRIALADLGLFSSISMVPVETSGANSVISYSILVREARSGTVSFGPGWSREEGLRFSLESSYNNIDGMGRKVFSKGTLNEERDQTALAGKSLLGRYAGVGYFEPWLFDKPVDGTLAFNYKAAALNNLWEISRSAEATLSHRVRQLRPKTRIEGFTRYKEAREEAEGSVKDATLIDSGNLQVREFGVRQITDGRNSLAWPTRGYRVTTDLSSANFVFGGSVKYIRWGLGYNVYHELMSNLVLAAGINYTTYENVKRLDSSNVLPSTERLLAGGPETNRGFKENTLGPAFVASNGSQLYDGGSRRSAHKLELRYQVIPETMALTTFIDSSNSSFSRNEEKEITKEHAAVDGVTKPLFGDNEPYPLEAIFTHPSYMWTKNYVSYGLAGNYLTPLGSVNLSFGWPWKRCLNNAESCLYPRGNSNYRKIQGAVVSLNIGANF